MIKKYVSETVDRFMIITSKFGFVLDRIQSKLRIIEKIRMSDTSNKNKQKGGFNEIKNNSNFSRYTSNNISNNHSKHRKSHNKHTVLINGIHH